MKRKTKTAKLPRLGFSAQLAADTVDVEARTVDVVFYSGAPVVRAPLFEDPFELEFEVSEKAAILDRLNAGASILDNHARFRGVDGILGVTEKAWIEGGKARATLRFSKRDDVEPIWQDVLDGVIRSVSMGTDIHELEEVTKKGAEMKRFRATSWEPFEISLVGVPADPGARIQASADQVVVLASSDTDKPCRVIFSAEGSAPTGGHRMKIKVRLLADVEDVGKLGDIVEIEEEDFDRNVHTTELTVPGGGDPSGGNDPDPGDPETASRLADQRIARDKARRSEIKRIAAYYDLDDVWAESQHQSGIGIDQVLARAEAERKKRAPKPGGVNSIWVGDDYETRDYRLEQMAVALSTRANRAECPEPARPYAHMSFAELALAALQLTGKGRGLDARRDRAVIFSSNLALHTTSDFPLLLANALNKLLLPEYENRAPTYRALAARRDFRDYRVHNFDRSGDFPVPLEVGEHGEYQHGTMGENQEQVTLLKYGRILGITRETLVNDDLGAFANLALKAARRAADFENATFYSVCILAAAGLGPNLSDGVAVYHANHGNVLTNGVPDVARLDEARQLMLAQQSIDGIRMNVMPMVLLVPPASAGLAERLTAPLSQLIGQGQAAAPVPNVNNWAGRLTPVTDGNLTGTRYYLLADPSDLEQYIYGYLDGAVGPRTEVRNGFETDGVEFKLALDFGCGAIEYRAGVTGNGA